MNLETVNTNIYFRVLDAAANRACEALRVIEDFVRFVQDDAFLVEQLKTLRHRFVQNVLQFPMPQRLAERETQKDVGTQISTKTEFQRSSLQAVLDANFSRLEESLRSLEEFSKLLNPEAAHEFEQIRYISYTIQKAVFFTLSGNSQRRQRLKNARSVVFVTDEAQVLRAADVFVLRSAKTSVIKKLVQNVRKQFESSLIFVFQDAAAVFYTSADGLLIESGENLVKDARTLLGSEVLIGVQISESDSLSSFLLDGIDFLAVPASRSSEIRGQTTLPVFDADWNLFREESR